MNNVGGIYIYNDDVYFVLKVLLYFCSYQNIYYTFNFNVRKLILWKKMMKECA